MLRRAAFPLVKPQHFRPTVLRTLPPFRTYSKQPPPDKPFRVPKSEGETSHSSEKKPLRKVPFSPITPPPKSESPPEADPAFGVNADKDIENVLKTVNQASNRPATEQRRVNSDDSSNEAHQQRETAQPDQAPQEPQEPQTPLPDLTRGIPSTLDAELRQARAKQTPSSSSGLNITEDPSEEPTGASSSGRGGSDIPRTEYVSSSDRKKDATFKYMYAFLGIGGILYSVYLGRNWDSEEEEQAHPDVPSGWGFGLFYNRIKARLGSTMSYYRDPVTTKLLPDEDADPNLRFPFVLVLSLEDMLVHSEWTRDKGWRVAKRPGLDYFLRYLSAYYEIALFTSQPMAMTEQILRKLDPYGVIRWPLFREATLYKDGGYIKDLSYLNRDLKKVLIIDTDPHHVKHQPENAIILPKWKGDPSDQTLVQFIPFLEYLATMGFEDVREVLKSFEGTYIPAEFARREKLMREKFEAQQREKRKTGSKKSLGGLASYLGLSSQQQHPDALNTGAMGDGMMIWDQIRERGQKQYAEFDRRIREEGKQWLEEREAEEKRFQEEQMKSAMGGWFGFLGKSDQAGEEKKS
ncbi:hypothetical protein PV10_04860 [Exophiala mesophila]|uniref:Mitochondrial import inner membrane translocase subunit TIM50 n=1 Tax=Exophiala mesophila TaxID=212818 RepID=A0A0D1WWB1_EXOME|nr:uncharacterized protein PV10_04860 [Exophiala mesophila]KIV93665.1 hypothetical protein PV10_04860 [Exophiala mesophila]